MFEYLIIIASVGPLVCHKPFNPLPDNKILDWSILKQIAEDILKCNKKWKISPI